MAIESRELRNCLGHFATGVTVVTCLADGEPHGATVNSFTAVSLDPPLVLVALGRHTKACRYLDGAPFTINVLRRRQDDLARHFAGRPSLDGVEWVPGTERLAGALAYLTCAPWRDYDGGDHVLFLGEVTKFEHHGGEPLVFYRGAFHPLGRPFEVAPWLGSLDDPDAGWLPAPTPRRSS
ncbi:flavin reductase family protein [Actinophytocola sp.]|uniref:flavin reductase family protein n=1 Tax=Actinophytocola sp. TaxID=1872138 RepID=UPI002ED1E0CC